MNNPLISVLMTAYNREDYIAEAIESVLASSFTAFELIITDDCSSDSSFSIAEGYAAKDKRVRVFKNALNQGDYPNRNTAASFARGKYIKYVDSDDKIERWGLAEMFNAMETFPDAAFGFSDCKPTGNKVYPIRYEGWEAVRKHFLEGGFLQSGPSTTIIKLDAFRAIGGFTGTRYISDYEAWLTLALSYPVVIFEPGLMWIRSHTGQEMDVGKLAYYSLNYNLHKNFISNTRTPFSPSERSNILYNYKILLGRRAYQRLLKWYGLRKTMQTMKAAGENYLIFLHALKPMKKIKL